MSWQKMMSRNPINDTKGKGLDFFETPVEATQALLRVETFTESIWEPACGKGAISQEFIKNGAWVYSSDIADRGYGAVGVDFLKETDSPFVGKFDFVTNPPFKYAEEFLHHMMDPIFNVNKVALLLRLMWLESAGRKERVFDIYPPSVVHVFSNRLKFVMPDGRKKSGMVPYAWFIWDKSNPKTNTPRLNWILA